jgi:hypothetical protein
VVTDTVVGGNKGGDEELLPQPAKPNIDSVTTDTKKLFHFFIPLSSNFFETNLTYSVELQLIPCVDAREIRASRFWIPIYCAVNRNEPHLLIKSDKRAKVAADLTVQFYEEYSDEDVVGREKQWS